MIYDHVSIGGGVIGLNTTINLLKKFLNCKFKKKINLCIIDKDLSNIPGGVAYGKKTSRHGYFNNPLRLSHKELQKYYLNYKNFNKLEDFIKLNGSQYDHRKFKIDLKILKSKNIKKKMEVYLPRVAFSFFQESIFCDLINKIQKSKKFVNLDFYQGDVHTFTNYKKKYLKITSNKSFEIFQLNSQLLNNKRISFLRKFFFDKSIIAKNITLGLGVTPPDKLIEKKNINNNYIWDFYSEGGTSYLVNKIENMVKAKKNLSLCFIGSKAGFLESLQEIYKAKIKYKSIKIYCFSKKFESLQPAKISFKKKITLKFLKKSRKDINTASKLYSAIFNELTVSKKKIDYKYLIWTKILSSNILNYFLKKLSKKELFEYQTIYFQKIRNLTRFTFPETIKIKDRMIKNKLIKIIKEKAKKVITKKNSIYVVGEKKKYMFDIVVNVTGPANIVKTSQNIPVYKSILKYSKKDEQVIVDANFSEKKKKNLFVPGTLAQGFNDRRQTIIKAILENSNKSSTEIFKRILKL